MTREEALLKLTKMTAEHLGIEEDKITEESNYIDDLGADSLDVVELVMAAEEEFGIEVSDDEAEVCETIAKSVDLILEKTGGED